MSYERDSHLDALMVRLAEGDRTAFTPVYQTLWPPLFRLCRSLLRNDADASDAAQQALEKILSRASDYDRTRPALPWALAIGAWECRTISRKRSRRREVPEDWASEPSNLEAGDAAEQRSLVAAALEALGTLSEVDRETLIATFRDESPHVSAPTFRKRRERALKRLRDAFKRLYGLD